MKKILLSLFFGLFCITNSYAVDLTVSSFDEPIFWQPTAIVNALKAFNATEEQFATFTDLFYEKTNNKTFGTQRISAETISKIWFSRKNRRTPRRGPPDSQKLIILKPTG